MSKKFSKGIKTSLSIRHYFKLILFAFFLISVSHGLLFSQSLDQEQLDRAINALNPHHSLKASLPNIDIIGFDIKDKDGNRLGKPEHIFSEQDRFDIVLYCQKNPLEPLNLKENKLENYTALLRHANGSYIRSQGMTSFLGHKEVVIHPEDWQVGGVYKIQFSFKVPPSAAFGKYYMLINKSVADESSPIRSRIDGIRVEIWKFLRIREKFINLEFHGFEVLDEKRNRLPQSKHSFAPGGTFYIGLYAQRRRIREEVSQTTRLKDYVVLLQHTNLKIRSKRPEIFLGDERVHTLPRNWEIGKTYRLLFKFIIPENAPLGKYGFKINKRRALTNKNTIKIDDIKIKILNIK